MKHLSSKINLLSITSIIFITCWNGSMVDSTQKDKRLDVNFYGTLNGEAVEDIAIGGKYKDIFFYKPIKSTEKSTTKESVDECKSSMAEQSPTTDKTALNLDDIAEISLKYPQNPTEHEIKINNNKYLEVEIKLINGSMHDYMLESSREISALTVDKGAGNSSQTILSKRTIKIPALKTLIIKGKKAAQDMNQSRLREDMENTDKAKIASNIEKDLDQIQQEVDNLSQHHPSQYEKFKNSIISLLRSIRDNLQKMLNMIKN